MEFLALLKEVGYENAELVGRTGFDSTPKTEGVLFRAVKPNPSNKHDLNKIMQGDSSGNIFKGSQKRVGLKERRKNDVK